MYLPMSSSVVFASAHAQNTCLSDLHIYTLQLPLLIYKKSARMYIVAQSKHLRRFPKGICFPDGTDLLKDLVNDRVCDVGSGPAFVPAQFFSFLPSVSFDSVKMRVRVDV
jgi:hypothetical protein